MKEQAILAPLRVVLWEFLVFSLVFLQFTSGAHAATVLRDGTYTIDYTVLKAENDSVSMANDYWEKPATVHVRNGEMQVELVLNHSSWITEFKVLSGNQFADVEVAEKDAAADKRLVRFPVADLTVPLESRIHVTVESVDYDHDYTIRLSFDNGSLLEKKSASDSNAGATAEKESTQTESAKVLENEPAGGGHTEKTPALQAAANDTAAASANETGRVAQENPKTGDRTPVIALVCLFIVSSVFVVRQVLPAGR